MHRAGCTVGQSGYLSDGCDGCDVIAENPTSLASESVLMRLVAMAVEKSVEPRTENQARAAARVLSTMERFGRIAEVAPDHASKYLRDCWNVPVA